MPYRAQIDDRGVITKYKDTDTGEVVSAKEFERRLTSQNGGYYMAPPPAQSGQMYAVPPAQQGMYSGGAVAPAFQYSQQQQQGQSQGFAPIASPAQMPGQMSSQMPGQMSGQMPGQAPLPLGIAPVNIPQDGSPLVQPGAQMLNGQPSPSDQAAQPSLAEQAKNNRMEGIDGHKMGSSHGYRTHGFLDATSIAILLPTLVLLALIIAAAHKKRLFPWQTIRTFNPPSGLMSPRDYERSFVCPPNLRRHGRMGKRNPQATWTDQDGIVIPFGFLARTHLPVTLPLGRLPNKNMFIVAPSGSGKTTLMRAIMKALLAKPCVMIALEAKANDPHLDEKKESFKHTVLPEAKAAGFDCLYFNPLDVDSINWNPLDLDPTSFASSIVQDVNSLPPEEQHWAERDHGYISGLTKLLKWGAVQVLREDENGQPAEVVTLPCNPRGLMRLVNSRRNIVESLRRLKTVPEVDPAELNEQTLTLSSIIRTDTDWDKNIQGVRGRLRMFRNESVLRCTEQSNVDIKAAMHRPTVLIFGAPASLGPDAESLAACFVYQLQQALHTRYGTASVLPLFAFFDEYQTLNIDLAGRLSAIVRGANGGLTVILQNIAQIAKNVSSDPTSGGASELKTLFSNCAIRVCLHNADESTSKFFSDEIGKHAVIVPGIADEYKANGFGIFPTSWKRIHSQQVVQRVDADTIKRMEKHHALVYLSPAGDPEFGETKPFMVDLRGIEEIARLHLLHNVSNRGQQDDPAAIPDMPAAVIPAAMPTPGGPSAPAASAVLNGAVNAAAAAASAYAADGAVLSTSAALVGPRQIIHAPQPVPLPAAGFAQQAPAFPGSQGPMTAAPFPGSQGPMTAAPFPGSQGPMTAAAFPGSQGPMAAAAFPGSQGPLTAAASPGSPGPLMSAPTAMAPGAPQRPSGTYAGALASAAATGVSAMQESATAQRVCPHCAKTAGKGRFCIECGKFVGPEAVAASQPLTQRQILQDGASLPQSSGQFGQYPLDPATHNGNTPFPFSSGQASTTGGSAPQQRQGQVPQMSAGSPISAGPQMSQAPQNNQTQQMPQMTTNPGARKPVTSLQADLSQFGITNNQGKKPSTGVEF